MANVYSHQFFASQGGAYAQATCPEGFRAVIRCITQFNSTTISNSTGHLIHQPSNATIYQWAMLPPDQVSGAQIVITMLHFVFDAGEYCETRNDGSCDMTVSGYLLTLP